MQNSFIIVKVLNTKILFANYFTHTFNFQGYWVKKLEVTQIIRVSIHVWFPKKSLKLRFT